MKKELNPGIVVAIIVCVLAIAGIFLYRTTTEKPAYPGLNAGKPAGESASGGAQTYKNPSEVHTSQEAAKQGFSGAAPGSNVPADVKGR